MAPSSSSSRNWVYDVFPSFRGKDVRVRFLSHFLRELDRKLITAFRDNEIERSRSLDPELVQAIENSKIAVVVFSRKYASSSWCLNELLEILRCKKELGQLVIPIFYRLDPSHVRKQTGGFGKIFKKTCKNRTENRVRKWRKALTDVANTLGYHSKNWDNEAKMIEDITNDISCKLKLTTPRDFDDYVGMEDHIAEVRSRLRLESEEVKMVGIWGPSGIGKTTIARAVFNRLAPNFQRSIFIDRAFVTKSMKVYRRTNPDDYNMMLDLQRNFLSEILGKRHIRIDHLGAVKDRLKRRKVLIVLDDLDDQVVLDTLAGETHWFGRGSRIIVISKDRHLLRAHGIDCVYKVGLPSDKLGLEMLCRYAFRQSCPLPGFTELAAEVANHVGYLPLGLKALGSYLRGRDKEAWILHGLRKGLDRKIEEALRVDYERLGSRKDKEIFRHIACLFNEVEINDIKLLLEDSDLDVTTGLDNLLDNSLIHERSNVVQMHCLVQEMGKEMVRTQSKNPIKREFLVDSKDICHVLSGNAVAEKLSGISLNLAELEDFNIDKSAFKRMLNLRFLRIYEDLALHEQCKLHLPQGLDYFPPELRLLCWDRYPFRCLPSSFRGKDLVVLRMRNSRLEKLWDVVQPHTYLEDMDPRESVKNLKEIANPSMATNFEGMDLCKIKCIGYVIVDVQRILKTLEGIRFLSSMNLTSLYRLDLSGCSRFSIFRDISRNISFLFLNQTAIEEVPWWIESFTKLIRLEMWECRKLKHISPNISKLKLLEKADFSYCDALTEASWLDRPSAIATGTVSIRTKLPVLNFINCFNLDQEALIQQSVFKYLILPGEKVPSFFTNQATGSNFAIHLRQRSLSQDYLRFRVCLLVDAEKPKRSGNGTATTSWVCCHFTCKDGNPFGYADCLMDIDLPRRINNHLIIFDCCFPVRKHNDTLLELNYDQVDTEIHFTSDSLCKIRGCGIRLSEDCQSRRNQRRNRNVLGNETERCVETARSRKRIKIT